MKANMMKASNKRSKVPDNNRHKKRDDAPAKDLSPKGTQDDEDESLCQPGISATTSADEFVDCMCQSSA